MLLVYDFPFLLYLLPITGFLGHEKCFLYIYMFLNILKHNMIWPLFPYSPHLTEEDSWLKSDVILISTKPI